MQLRLAGRAARSWSRILPRRALSELALFRGRRLLAEGKGCTSRRARAREQSMNRKRPTVLPFLVVLAVVALGRGCYQTEEPRDLQSSIDPLSGTCSTSCAPYLCKSGACATSCGSNTDCVSGY